MLSSLEYENNVKIVFKLTEEIKNQSVTKMNSSERNIFSSKWQSKKIFRKYQG